MAILAVAAVAGGVVSDVTSEGFWARHALLAGLASSVIVVMLSVAVINEVLERRRRKRWRVLAQYVMFQLVRNARMVWSGILEVAGLSPTVDDPRDRLDAGAQIVRDTPRLTAALREAVSDEKTRLALQEEFALLAEHADQVLGRWAGVMLSSDVYAEIVDRHVELAGDIGWIGDLLDGSYPPDDLGRQRRARNNPATQIWSELGPEWLADRLVVISQLAERLDSGTLELALQIVPVEWWNERLATRPDPDPGVVP